MKMAVWLKQAEFTSLEYYACQVQKWGYVRQIVRHCYIKEVGIESWGWTLILETGCKVAFTECLRNKYSECDQ